MDKQKRGYSFSCYYQFCNVTVWKDSGVVFIVDDAFIGGKEQYIAGKVHNKTTGDYSGYCKVKLIFIQ